MLNAVIFVSVENVDELKEILRSETAKSNDLLILGGGSNLLLTQNIDALVIKMSIKGIKIEKETEENVWVSAFAGENWHEFVLKTLEMNYYGLENLSLIPGCVGASPMQNIGAYGVEIKDYFDHLEALNLETLEIESFDNASCEFGYRESVFKRKYKGKYIITKVFFKLNKKYQTNTSYGAIEQELSKMGIDAPTPKDVSNAVISIRKSKLPDPKEIGNSGSFFKNPVVSIELYQKIKNQFPEVVSYLVDEQNYKLAAGWLIDNAGWKGKTIGNYGVHKLQALVLVNYGGATGKEIYDLSEAIILSIKEKYGVTLEREVNIL
jgi:UDP-N-acetylmuramate dehydrogenase